MKTWMVIPIILLVAGVIGGAGYYGYQSSRVEETPVVEPPTVVVDRGEVVQSVTAPGSLVDAGETTLQPRVAATVDEVKVRAGDRVKAGQTLAMLGSREQFEAAVTEARIKVLEAQAALEKQQSGLPLAEARVALAEAQNAYDKAERQRQSKDYARASSDTVDVARAHYLVAEEAVSDAEAFYDQFDHLAENDPGRAEALSQLAAARQERNKALANLNWLLGKPNEQEVSEADANLELTKAQLEQAQQRVNDLLQDGGTELALAEAQLSNAEAALAQAEANLQSLEVKAPFDGVVTEVKVKPGETVTAGTPLIVISDPKALMAEVTVVEEDYPLVEPGQTAELFFDAMPEANVTGQVEQVVPRRATGDRALYTLYLSLDSIPNKVAPGMTVDASIVINRKDGVLRLPRSVVRARSDGSAQVQVWTNGQIEEREIWVNLRGDSYVEIVSGIEEGEKVVTR